METALEENGEYGDREDTVDHTVPRPILRVRARTHDEQGLRRVVLNLHDRHTRHDRDY